MATELGSKLDQGITLPFSWFADPDGLPGGAGADLRPHLAVRRRQPTGWPSRASTSPARRPVPVVVVRDHDGRISGFVNICRHRATEVASGRGQARDAAMPLPRVDVRPGRLPAGAPRSEREPGFDRVGYGLLPVAVDTWGPSGVRQPRPRCRCRWPSCWAGCPASWPMPASTSTGCGTASGSEWELEANWKAVVENYLECYHCPTAHPASRS